MKEMKKIDILLIEDNEDHVELTVGALSEAKVINEIITARTGSEGLEYLHRKVDEGHITDFLPGLILLDIKLPDMSGLEVLRHIKEHDKMKSIPIIMLTSSARDKDINQAYELGANSYIEKPVQFGEFYETVKEIPLYWALINKLPEGTYGA